jgi:hypothetical protein
VVGCVDRLAARLGALALVARTGGQQLWWDGARMWRIVPGEPIVHRVTGTTVYLPPVVQRYRSDVWRCLPIQPGVYRERWSAMRVRTTVRRHHSFLLGRVQPRSGVHRVLDPGVSVHLCPRLWRHRPQLRRLVPARPGLHRRQWSAVRLRARLRRWRPRLHGRVRSWPGVYRAVDASLHVRLRPRVRRYCTHLRRLVPTRASVHRRQWSGVCVRSGL